MASNKSIKNKRLVMYIILSFSTSFLLINYDLLSYESFVKIEFLFTFMGVFIGFAISIYTYITSIFDKIKEKLSIEYKSKPDVLSTKRELLIKVHSGMRDDINFMIGGLVLLVMITLFEKPLSKLDTFIYKWEIVVNSIFLSLFILTIFAIWDLIKTAFILSDFLAKHNE